MILISLVSSKFLDWARKPIFYSLAEQSNFQKLAKSGTKLRRFIHNDAKNVNRREIDRIGSNNVKQ